MTRSGEKNGGCTAPHRAGLSGFVIKSCEFITSEIIEKMMGKTESPLKKHVF